MAQKLRQCRIVPQAQRIVVAARQEPVGAAVPHAQNERVFLLALGVTPPSRDHVGSCFAAEPRNSLAVVGDQFPVVPTGDETDDIRGTCQCDRLEIYDSCGDPSLRCVRNAEQRMLA